MADDLTFTPTGKPPDRGLKFTRFASDGSAAVRSIFPGAVVTSGHRTNNIGSPTDDHHFSNGAVDVAPIKGMTFDQFTARLKSAGYPIIQAIDEVKHPSKGATGPHWHVALGEHESGLAFTPHQKPAGARQSALTFTPDPSGRKAPEGAQRAGNPPSRPDKELSLGQSLVRGVKNIPRSAVDTVKGIGHAIAHPVETADSIGGFVSGAIGSGLEAAGVEKLGIKPSASDREDMARFHQSADPWLKHPYRQLKKSFAEDPVGTALTFTPIGGGARIVGKLGVRGVDAAHLASLTPEARAALKAKRVEDAAVAKRYKDVARPIMAQHRLDAERAAAELRKHQKTVGNLPAAEQRGLAIAADTGDREGIAPEHHAALDTVRKVAKDYDKRIHDIYSKGGHSLPEFMDDYYTHLWKEDPAAVKAAMGRQGSSRSLKARTIPTLADGIRAGLTPKYENMLDTMTHYAHTMSKHLVNHDLMNAMRKDPVLGAKFVPKHHIPEGMSRVEGIGTEREGRGISKQVDGQDIHTGNAPPMVLAAKTKAADLYNKRIGKSVMDNPVGRAVKRASGSLVAVKLFSLYHPTLIAGKSIGSDIGNGLRHLTRGAPIDALKALAHMPFAPVATAMQGAKMGRRLLQGEREVPPELEVHLSPDSDDSYANAEFIFRRDNGERVDGRVAVDHRGRGVIDIEGKSVNKLGPSEVRKLAGQLADQVPNLKTLYGRRVTGARDAAGIKGHEAVARVDVEKLRGKYRRTIPSPMNEIDHLYVKAGGSTGGGLAPFHTIDQPSMAESAARGTFRSDLKRSFEKGFKGTAKGVARTALRALGAVNDLVFQYYVPAIKRGAFERELQTSLKAHPEWGDAEKLAEAKNVLSSIDGRMGLVTKDNLFWSNTAHDIGRVIFLSPSWQLGNARIINDAMKSVPKEQKGFFAGKGITNGRAQAAGLLGSYMLGNAVLQYLYTGQRPEGVQDLMAARTGGKNKDGTDERVTTPSVIPELYRWFSAPEEEAGNVLNPGLKTQGDLVQNRDFRDQPIYRPDYASPWPHSRPRDIAEYELQGATPIPFSGNDNDQSNVGALARIVGLRPAGKSIANPEGYEAMRRSIADRESRPVVKRERVEDAKRKKKK